MQWFVFLFFYGFLLTVVRPNPINEEIHSETFKSKRWPTNRTLTWKLDYDHSLYDSRKTRQDIQQAFDDWARYTELTFREVTDGEKADFNLAFVSGDHSDGAPFDGPGGQISHTFSPGNRYAGHIHFDSTEKWSHTYDGIGYNLRLVAAHEIGSSLGLPHSNDRASIMSPFHRLILPNEMLPKQDQDSIQALYGKKKNPMITVRPSRRVRSITTKQTKTTKKQRKKTKKNKKNKKTRKTKRPTRKTKRPTTTTKRPTKATKRPTTTTSEDIKMTDERQLVTFDASELAKIAKAIKALEPDKSFTAFSNISDILKKATGRVSQAVTPILQQLSVSHSNTTILIKVALATTCGILSKFVIKSYRVVERGGMSNDDKKVFMDYEKQLNTDNIIKSLAAFVDSSRLQLLQIYNESLLKVGGDRAIGLLKKRDALGVNLTQRSEALSNKFSEYGTNEGKIESLRYEKEMFEQTAADSMKAKKAMEQEINNLQKQATDYEKQRLDHRDTHMEVGGRFWFISWTEHVYIDNGERIVRENLNRLLERIRVLQGIVQNWSNIDLTKHVPVVLAELGKYEGKKKQLEKERAALQILYDEAEKEFRNGTRAIESEMDEIYKSAGTVDIESIKVVDELGRAVLSGQYSIVNAYAKMVLQFKEFSIDTDLLVYTVQGALQFINMVDAYLGTTKIQNVIDVLGLQKTFA